MAKGLESEIRQLFIFLDIVNHLFCNPSIVLRSYPPYNLHSFVYTNILKHIAIALDELQDTKILPFCVVFMNSLG